MGVLALIMDLLVSLNQVFTSKERRHDIQIEPSEAHQKLAARWTLKVTDHILTN